MKILLNFLLIITAFFAHADMNYQFPVMLNESIVIGNNQLYVEPRFAHATFSTCSIKQIGYLYGIRGGYDWIAYGCPYFGFESHYMTGKLKQNEVKSTYTDLLFEGKGGFTFGAPGYYLIAPYCGVGYEKQKNDYTTTPVDKLCFYYASLGFASDVCFNPCFSMGCHFKVKIPFHGNQDSENDRIKARVAVSKKLQYFVEVPLTYWASSAFAVSVVPFYEYKVYNINSIGDSWLSCARMHQWGASLRGTVRF